MATLEDIDRKLDLLLAAINQTASPAPLMSIGEQAIMMARQGKVQESMELLRAHSKRRSKKAGGNA